MRGLLVDVVLAKEERTENAARFVLRQRRRGVHHFLEHGVLGVERVGAMLAEVTDLRVVPEVAFAFLKLDHAGENLEQRGFARAIRPDQHRALAAFNREIEAAINLVRRRRPGEFPRVRWRAVRRAAAAEC